MHARIFLVSLLLFLFGHISVSYAHVPVLVSQESLLTVTAIDDPELSQAFYGQMTGFPHTFQIVATEPFLLSAKILLPDIDSSQDNVSGVIIQQPEGNARVIEVGLLDAKTADWNMTYEPFGGDTYREGPAVEKEVGPGTYRIEVHTPDNVEKYVLVVGKREEMSIGYFETLQRLIRVKEFFGKSAFHIVESLYVCVPLLIVVATVATMYWKRRRKGTTV